MPRHSSLLIGLLAALPALSAEIVKFRPPVGEALEVWRLTHDPAVRDSANYHNTQCWSPDGRHLAFTRYAADEKEYGADTAAEIRLFDFSTQQEILVERGLNPRWANHHPWLIYNRLRPADGPRNERGTQLVRLDLATGEKAVVGYGVGRPTMVSHDDRYIYGIWYPAHARSGDGWEPYEGEPKAARFELREGAQREILPGDFGVGYNSLLASPGRPVIVTRNHSFLCFPSGRDNSGPYDNDAKGSPDGTKIAFVSTYDLEHGPAAGIVEGSTGDEIRVDSTAGFPESGELVNPAGFGGEIIGYRSKTPTSFRGLTSARNGLMARVSLPAQPGSGLMRKGSRHGSGTVRRHSRSGSMNVACRCVTCAAGRKLSAREIATS